MPCSHRPLSGQGRIVSCHVVWCHWLQSRVPFFHSVHQQRMFCQFWALEVDPMSKSLHKEAPRTLKLPSSQLSDSETVTYTPTTIGPSTANVWPFNCQGAAGIALENSPTSSSHSPMYSQVHGTKRDFPHPALLQ
jgi:hypothetical protein